MTPAEKARAALGVRILDWREHSPRRIYITVRPEDLTSAAEILFKKLGFRFSIATGTDTPENIEITYHFSCDATGQFFSLRVLLEDKENPEVDSIAGLTKGAEWIEREIWELLGVNFKGHPDLRRLLLAEDWPEGKYPLRREEKQDEPGNSDG